MGVFGWLKASRLACSATHEITVHVLPEQYFSLTTISRNSIFQFCRTGPNFLNFENIIKVYNSDLNICTMLWDGSVRSSQGSKALASNGQVPMKQSTIQPNRVLGKRGTESSGQIGHQQLIRKNPVPSHFRLDYYWHGMCICFCLIHIHPALAATCICTCPSWPIIRPAPWDQCLPPKETWKVHTNRWTVKRHRTVDNEIMDGIS